MICHRCGATLNSEQRYCMKCGALNYEHPDNQKMKQYITDQELEQANQEYQKATKEPAQTIEIAGQVFSDGPEGNKKTTYVDTRVMLVLLLIFTICLASIYYFVFPYSVTMVISLCILFFIFVFFILTNISVYMKGGYSGFVSFIPFYSQYAYFDIVFGKGWLFLISFIPVVGVFYMFYVLYKTGKVFGKSGWFTLFFPFIMLPIIAFSDKSVYVGPSRKYQSYVERGRMRNTKFPAFICSIIVFFLFLAFTQLSFADYAQIYFTQKDIQRVTNSVKKDIFDGMYFCDGTILTAKDGDFYISVEDLSDVQLYPIPIRSSLNGKKLSGYFYIQIVNKKTTISGTFTDGDNTFFTDKQEISKFTDVSVPEGAILCTKED